MFIVLFSYITHKKQTLEIKIVYNCILYILYTYCTQKHNHLKMMLAMTMYARHVNRLT